jgi:hypothetical protein
VEALILHYVDDLDSKCQAMQDLIKAEAGQKGNWTSFNRNLSRYIYKKRYVSGEGATGEGATGEAEPPRVPDEREAPAESEVTAEKDPVSEPAAGPDLPQGKLFD